VSYVVGVDIGGTFTDAVIVDDTGRATIGKSSSTPPDFETGFMAAVLAAAENAGLTLDALLADTSAIYHGSTIGTNALVEGNVAKVGFLTTRGHRDALFMMQAGERLRGLPPDVIAHVALHQKPEPLVPKRLIREIDERVASDGRIVVSPGEDGIRAAIAELLAERVDAFAVCFLWSPVNFTHELLVEQIVHELAPEAFVSLSSEVAPRPGEYQRSVATVLNAAIGPVMSAYLTKLERALDEHGYSGGLQLMSCSGGLIDAEEARRRPVLTVGSGPTAGVIGSASLATAAHRLVTGDAAANAEPGIITTDTGGTTLDVALISKGIPATRPSSRHGQYEYYVPTVDVQSVGSGGGSIIWFDERFGSLRVGPRSAGARPGPACYGRGGTEATITDADVVLGYLNPDNFLGGRIDIDVDAARQALVTAGAPLGYSAEQVAAAAVKILESQMADAIRLMCLQKGQDARNMILYAYGGAGPVHAGGYAVDLGTRRILIPLGEFAAGWSAFGVSTSEALIVREAGAAMAAPFDPEAMNVIWARLEDDVAERLRRQGIAPQAIRLERSVDMKYAMQTHVLPLLVPGGTCDAAAAEDMLGAFDEEYERLFGKGASHRDAGYALTGMRVNGRAAVSGFALQTSNGASGAGPIEPTTHRDVIAYAGGDVTTTSVPIYSGPDFRFGHEVAGPAILEYPDTTVVLRSEQRASMDQLGNVIVEL
jgi:N-methylhydantoinase A